jgi:hypothetical protein
MGAFLVFIILILIPAVITAQEDWELEYETPLPPLQKADGDFPPPGSRYKVIELHQYAANWRVTDPEAYDKSFLPNSVYTFTVESLENVERADVMIDRWGGHPMTSEKMIRVNGSEWLPVPEPYGTQYRPEFYVYQGNPSVEIPLEHLKAGENTLEAVGSFLIDYGWGQWGAYSFMIRLFYNEPGPEEPRGKITNVDSGDILPENPMIRVAASSEGAEITEVHCFAHVYDYDYDGDGHFTEWQGAWHQLLYLGTDAEWENHIGTDREAPFEFRWDTGRLPDQEEGSVSLTALIVDSRNRCYVLPAVNGLSFDRPDESVQLYRAAVMPPEFVARFAYGRFEITAEIVIPEDAPLDRAVEAGLHLMTWNGTNREHGDFTVNGTVFPGDGLKNFYAYSFHKIPPDILKHGNNEITFASETRHHGLEVLWPGPALVIKYKK